MKSFFAIFAALSTLTYARPTSETPLAPWQGPAKFIVSITASINDPTTRSKGPVTYYLSNKGDGTGTQSKSEAAVCSISVSTELVCSTSRGSVKVSTTNRQDMVPMTNNGGINTGFSVDGSGVLHWENGQFMNAKSIQNVAKFALYPTGGKVYLYADLGCPTGLHFIHSEMIDGGVKITPVD